MEKVPRKKMKRSLKKGTWLTLIACAAALCALCVYLLRATAPLPEIPEKEMPQALLSGGSEAVAAVSIQAEDGEGYVLRRTENGVFLEGREGMALREKSIEEIWDFAGSLASESTVINTRAQAVNLADFGLAPARLRVGVTRVDGSESELLIGDETPQEMPQRYCMIAGNPYLYTVLASACDVFFHDAAFLRDFDQPALDASLLDRIEISGSLSLDMHYTPSGWILDAPLVYPLSTARMKALLSSVESMGFDACMGCPEETSLSAWGLAAPSLTVRLTQAATRLIGQTSEGESVSFDVPEKTYTLLLGNDIGESGVYVLWEGMVYRASNFVLGFWKDLTVDDLLLREPVNFLINNLNGVEFQTASQRAAYRVELVESITENNQIATDEYGQTLYDCEVYRQGEKEPMEAERFLQWYTSLASLTAAGRLREGFAPSGGPDVEIVLKNDTLTRTIALYPYDALHDAIFVDGVGIFYTEKSWLDTVMPAP